MANVKRIFLVLDLYNFTLACFLRVNSDTNILRYRSLFRNPMNEKSYQVSYQFNRETALTNKADENVRYIYIHELDLGRESAVIAYLPTLFS